MIEENWKEFLTKIKNTYKDIGYITCPAFHDENIHFNHYGFKHILFKTRKFRARSDIRRRFFLLPYAVLILKNNKDIHHYEERIRDGSTAHFWEIRKEILIGSKNRVIRIVIRKLNDSGKIHFFSVYDK